jgi:carbon-monoxide dehydrogenase iron sulfur subunit
MLCPYGAVVQLNELKKAVKCDLCPDREIPACVEACPTKALIWCRIDELPEIYKNPLPVIMSDDNE